MPVVAADSAARRHAVAGVVVCRRWIVVVAEGFPLGAEGVVYPMTRPFARGDSIVGSQRPFLCPSLRPVDLHGGRRRERGLDPGVCAVVDPL